MVAAAFRFEEDAREIFRSAVEGVSPERLVDAAVFRHDLEHEINSAGRAVLLACGKAACGMSERLLHHMKITEGLVTFPHGGACRLPPGVEVITSAHPVPDRSSENAARRALALAQSLGEGEIALVLISGGGSSLWAGVPSDLKLEHKQDAVRELLRSGASIDEINAVRKHLSTIKGGRLARAVHPGRCISLIISDVVGDSLSVIASGPTVADETTFDDALEVLRAFGGMDRYPAAVVDFLRRGSSGAVPETPKPSEPVFSRNQSFLIGSNRDAVETAARAARYLGYDVCVESDAVVGDAAEAGKRLGAVLLNADVDRPTCFVWGGETTVVVEGDGKGGRNQEMALAAAIVLEGAVVDAVFLSGGTDGIDGPTDAAGAVVTRRTVEAGLWAGCSAEDYLRDNDSYGFFSRVGGHLKTGPTGTNVMDIQIGLVMPASPRH